MDSRLVIRRVGCLYFPSQLLSCPPYAGNLVRCLNNPEISFFVSVSLSLSLSRVTPTPHPCVVPMLS